MSAMLLTTLMSPSIALLRGSALVAGPRAPLVANMLRSRGGATMAVANAKTAPAAVPLTAATISASSADIASWSGDLLLLPCWEAAEKNAKFELPPELSELDSSLDGFLSSLAADEEFKGKAGSSVSTLLPKGSAVRKAALVGLGKQEGFSTSGATKWGAALATIAKEQKAKAAAALVPSLGGEPLSPALQSAALTATLLGLSPDLRYKSSADPEALKKPPLATLDLLGGADMDAARKATSLAQGILMTRGLVGSPANYLTPTAMAEAATAIAGMSKGGALTIQVLEKAECEALGMGSYLGVSQGAMEPPKFIHMTLSPPGGKVCKRVCLIGKGLTFDSGGYNIKAGAGSMIEKMKFDMGGAGAVLGAARVLADAPPAGVEVHFIVAACENMVSETAMRPGDILTASNGKTIEVVNTDAEGRLTLADALVYAETKTGGKVDAIVDVATLTGACIIALGPAYAGLWSDNDELSDKLLGSAKASGEPLWRMPLAPEYAEQIKSPISDLKNLGNGPQGGSITAALFLKEFVKETPWAHMDIAGPVWDDKQGGATGYGVKTLVDFVESHAA